MRAESTSNKREHWGSRAARSKRERKAVTLLLKPKLGGGLGKIRLVVTLTRIAPNELDDDNLRGSLKAFRDGVATALRVDDSTPLLRWDYGQRKSNEPSEYAVEVLISWETPSTTFDDIEIDARERRHARSLRESAISGGFASSADFVDDET